MYIIFHEPTGKTIITDEQGLNVDEYQSDGMHIEYIDNDVEGNFPISQHGVRVYRCADVEKLKKLYLSDKQLILAAGGMIYNSDGNLLMMNRKGLWDMPKGKLDEGESIEDCALREVSEETGLTSLQLHEKLTVTYHTYYFKDNLVAKPSHWFKMKFIGTETPKPQIEEEISQIRWVNKEEARNLMDNMYPSIQEMLLRFYL